MTKEPIASADSRQGPQLAQAASIAAHTGAALMIATSAALGSYFAFNVGASQHVALGIILAAGALGGELLKPFAFVAALQALASWQPLRAATCLILGAVCVVYSLSSELALSASSRGDLAAQRGRNVEAAANAKQRHDDAKRELDRLLATKPRGQLEAEIAALLLDPMTNGCTTIDGPVSKRVCPAVANLRAELARATERERLQAVMIETEGKREGVEAVASADPLADAVVLYSAAAGLNLQADAVATWLHLIVVLFLEVGSAFGLIVALAVSATGSTVDANGGGRTEARPNGPQAVSVQAEPVVESTVDTAEPMNARVDTAADTLDNTTDKAAQRKPSVSKRSDAQARLLDALHDNGGKLMNEGVRGLAKLIGGRKSTVHNALVGLLAAGVVSRMADGALVLRS
jgi:hypothetical protein